MRSGVPTDERARLRATRELAHSATALASEAANLARSFAPPGSDAGQTATQASITAAEVAFAIDERLHRSGQTEWLPLARQSLEAARSAIEAALEAVESAAPSPHAVVDDARHE